MQQIAIEIERQGGDSNGFASPREGLKTIRALADEVEAWRQAGRTYRRFFSSWARSRNTR
ncbi:hypothetical protein J4G43_003655 [Bradyrhizobium barranii subsp. barranii]|uniref:Uncharacterized protein n=1 Tax=Bradyrhizobium barranii subsp. barranii TaxID=2823807 RepID=A0A939S1P0_9BRAD|nr:hypothetical protein [Bradyrhizobium barranii]UEM13444.1 hypothetical protein J4G43_003655 [Bradyrhizobium barranii subsp. barranii]